MLLKLHARWRSKVQSRDATPVTESNVSEIADTESEFVEISPLVSYNGENLA